MLLRIVPPLVGLLTAVYMLRASGALDLAARRWPRCSPPWASRRRPWHSCWCDRSAARQHWGGGGAHRHLRPRLLIGRTAAVMLGSTETTFYTIAVYFGAAGIVKTRYAVPAALCADLAGFMAAAWAVRVIFY